MKPSRQPAASRPAAGQPPSPPLTQKLPSAPAPRIQTVPRSPLDIVASTAIAYALVPALSESLPVAPERQGMVPPILQTGEMERFFDKLGIAKPEIPVYIHVPDFVHNVDALRALIARNA